MESCSECVPAWRPLICLLQSASRLMPRPTRPLQAAPVIVAAADDGGVSVYSLVGLYDAVAAAEAAEGVGGSAERWREEQRRRLEAALRLHTYQQLSD